MGIRSSTKLQICWVLEVVLADKEATLVFIPFLGGSKLFWLSMIFFFRATTLCSYSGMGYWYFWHAYNCRVYTRLACSLVCDILSWRIDMLFMESFVLHLKLNCRCVVDDFITNIPHQLGYWLLEIATDPWGPVCYLTLYFVVSIWMTPLETSHKLNSLWNMTIHTFFVHWLTWRQTIG